MISYIPMYGIAYVLFILANLFGLTAYLFKDFPFEWLLPSGKIHNPTWSYIILFIGILFLFVEIIKALKTNNQAIIDHILSALVFILFLTTYLIEPWAGNSVFLIFTFFSLVDILLGFAISISSARRDIGIG
jgi:hypothetical protein